MRIASAIDIGSNGIRLALGTRDGNLALRSLGTWREPIRLGQDVFSEAAISEATLEKLEQSLIRLQNIIEQHQADSPRVVGTSAMREATNAKKVIKHIRKRTGLEIEIISAAEEARIAFTAVAATVNLGNDPCLLIDIGGGSIQHSYIENAELLHSESAPMGAVRLLQLFRPSTSQQRVLNRLLREYARGVRQQLIQQNRRPHVTRCYGIGGNIEALGDLQKSISKDSEPDRLSAEMLNKLIELLQGLSIEERILNLGLRPDRADVIFPAAVVLAQLLHESGVQEVIIPRVGLKDGLLLEQLQEQPPSLTARRQALFDFGVELGRRFQFDETHGRAVAKLARELFLQTQSIHKLPERYLLPLELGALLHDIGQFISYPKHHKHSYYILTQSTFVGLLPWEQQLMASLARYHRKGTPHLSQDAYREIPSKDRDSLLVLASLIRIADGLDRQHQGRVSSLSLSFENKAATLQLNGSQDLLLEIWAAKKKAGLFEDVFGTALKVEGGESE